jgi:NADH:ubiquinone oxidoreductase subunit 5 (subunit L)/multisubunit Na+/H+ antiporter MnhA subunit
MQRRVFWGKPGKEFNNVKETGFMLAFPSLILAFLIIAIGILFPFLARFYTSLPGILGG